ncbi:hypothetical protein FALCPG4_011540 [Fusarium falciforme]
MAPESSREEDTRHRAPPKRRLSTHGQEPDDHESKRARIGDYLIQSQPASSTNSAPSTSPFYVGQADTTIPLNENTDNASEGNKQWSETRQYQPPNTTTLTVVERATVLCKPIPFSHQRQLLVLDISFGSTCQTNFCAQVEGFGSMWVAKLSCTDLCDELFRHVLGEDDTRLLCGIMVGEKQSSQVMRMHPGGTGLTGNRNIVHIIMWPQAEPGNGPSRDMNLGEEAGVREFVEMIGGCWIE